jgi:hypothetical protein
MHRSVRLIAVLGLIAHSAAWGQTFTTNSSLRTRASATRDARVADERGNAADALAPAGASLPPSQRNARVAGPLTTVPVAAGEPSLGRISAGSGVLPNDAGQVWREYDLTPYTSKIPNVDKPEQAVIDWILRDTGTETWFGTPLGILSANKSTLRVYHTPDVQEVVKGMYDRFMATSAGANRLHVRVITINNPNWRSRAMALLKPVDVKSTGVEAWLVSRESAALLLGEFRKRADYREIAAPVVDIPNGQSYPLGLTRPRQYVRSIRPKAEFPGYEADQATIDEGYSLTISPLTSVDGRALDAVVKCNIDQIEKMIEVPLDIPVPLGQPQRMSIQVPQIVSWRLNERFRWPSDQLLLLSCGVVATPTNEKGSLPVLGGLVGTNRADALLLIEPVSGLGALPNTITPSGLPTLTPPAAAPGTGSLIPPTTPGTVPFTAAPLMPPSSHLRLR